VKHLVIVLAAVAGSAAAATPAAAQYYGAEVDIISPREATEVVRAAGLDPISRPVWRPGRYIVHAIDRYGRELRVVVDARMGDVVRAVPVGGYADIPPRGYEPYPRAAMPPAEMEAPEEFDDAGVPPPDATPHVIPAPRSSAVTAPSRSAALPKPSAPKQAPLPRSRPAEEAKKPDAPAAPKAEPVKPEASTVKAEAATTPPAEAPKEIRKIDMSKPKPAQTPETKTSSAPEVKALDDPSAKPRF
jgi:hypothetical protein